MTSESSSSLEIEAESPIMLRRKRKFVKFSSVHIDRAAEERRKRRMDERRDDDQVT